MLHYSLKRNIIVMCKRFDDTTYTVPNVRAVRAKDNEVIHRDDDSVLCLRPIEVMSIYGKDSVGFHTPVGSIELPKGLIESTQNY